MKALAIFILLLLPFSAISQTANLDSLVKVTALMKNDTTKANNLILISNRYRTEKIDHPNAKKYAELSKQLAEQIKYQKGIFKASIALAYVTRDMGLHPQGIELLKQALVFFETNKMLVADQSLHITHVYTYTALADLYTYLPDYANAQKNAFKALALSEQYQTGIGQCWITLSIIFSKQNNLEEANKYALKAVDFFKTNKSNDDLARTYAYLGRYAFTAANYAQAINNYQLSYDTYKKANSLFGQRIALYNLAEIYLKIKEYAKADYYVNETLKISTSANDVIYQFFINQLKFNINFDGKKYEEALVVADLLLSLAAKEKNLENINAVYQKYLAVYKVLNDTAKAFVVLEKINTLKDSIYNIETAKQTADLLKKYESEKKEQQIQFLDKENKFKTDKLFQEHLLTEALQRENYLQDEQIKQSQQLQQGLEREYKLKKDELLKESLLNKTLKQSNDLMVKNSRNESIIRWLMVLLLVAVVVFGINYYRNYQLQKLTTAKISKQAEDLRVLMREVHHRVKNNLQVTISMLRMQARNIEDKSAVEALLNSENRLQSIALVHEKLYKSDNVSGVNLKEYLQDLLNALTIQYNSVDKKVSYSVIDNTNLVTTIDTAIPIGMIVNELVTNSFKYAFTSTAEPNILVQLDALDNHNYQLTVQDNGQGFNKGQMPNNGNGLGLKLVHLFTEQLNGVLDYSSNNGTRFTITFIAQPSFV